MQYTIALGTYTQIRTLIHATQFQMLVAQINTKPHVFEIGTSADH